jgi:hypothetical protein
LHHQQSFPQAKGTIEILADAIVQILKSHCSHLLAVSSRHELGCAREEFTHLQVLLDLPIIKHQTLKQDK